MGRVVWFLGGWRGGRDVGVLALVSFAVALSGGVLGALFGAEGVGAVVSAGVGRGLGEWGGAEVFFEAFVKYGKYVCFIWLMAFLPHGFLPALAALGVRGAAFGACLGAGAGLLAALPQNIISFCAYIYLSVLVGRTDWRRGVSGRYFAALGVGGVAALFCALLDIFFAPTFIKFVT